jgi:tetratricopeptide (TPR) repeat protein
MSAQSVLAGPKAGQSVQTLVRQGNEALANQNFIAARDAFSDALATDPGNAAATAGLGTAYAGLKNYVKATPLLEKAVAANPNNRVIVYNAAAAHIDGNSAMRGAKIIKDYLTSHPTAPDEPMANALAIALAQADPQARKNNFYQQVAAFYKTYNAKLEAASPGMKRWGIEWIPASDFAQKQADAASKQKELDDANAALATCDEKLNLLKSELPAAQQRVQGGLDTQDSVDDLNKRISDQQDKQTQLTSDRDAALAGIPAPTFPTTLDCVTAETMPPASVDGQPVADNSVPNVTGIVPKVRPGHHDDSVPTPVAQTPDAPTPDAPTAEPEHKAPAKPTSTVQYAAAFPIAPDLLISAAAPLNGATKVELLNSDGNPVKAQVVRTDDAAGLALLRLTEQKMAYLPLADDFKGGAIECAALPKVDFFNPTAEMLTGTAPAPTDGAGVVWKVHLSKLPRLPGAPLLLDGKIVGVQLIDPDAQTEQLPAITLAQLKKFIGADLPAMPGNATPAGVVLQLSATKAGDAP